MKLKLINRNILVRKCYKPHILKEDGSVLLYLDDTSTETTNFATLLDVSPLCEHFSKEDIGGIVLCPEWVNGMMRVEKEDFVIPEEEMTLAIFEKENDHA